MPVAIYTYPFSEESSYLVQSPLLCLGRRRCPLLIIEPREAIYLLCPTLCQQENAGMITVRQQNVPSADPCLSKEEHVYKEFKIFQDFNSSELYCSKHFLNQTDLEKWPCFFQPKPSCLLYFLWPGSLFFCEKTNSLQIIYIASQVSSSINHPN